MFHFLEVGLFDAPVLTNDDTSQSEQSRGAPGNVIGFAVCQRPWGVREDGQTMRAWRTAGAIWSEMNRGKKPT